MAFPNTEINIFETSDLFRAHPDILGRGFELLRDAGVDVPIYSGLGAKDPNVGLIVINWENYEQHQKIMKAPFIAEFVKALAPAVASPPTVYHAQLSGPAVGLDQPVTEVVIVTLKNPENRAALEDYLSMIPKLPENTLVSGQTREDENKYIAILGWDTIEAHEGAASKPEGQELIKKLGSVGELDRTVYYANLKKF